jgi:antitoxin (DNA-binding transcriptional repressor) of toxin-antitoxin stability system
MKKVELAAATASLADYAQTIDEPLVITKKGRPIAALVAIQDADWESLSLSTNPDFIALIVQSRERQHAEGGIPVEELRRRLGLVHEGVDATRSVPDADTSRRVRKTTRR